MAKILVKCEDGRIRETREAWIFYSPDSPLPQMPSTAGRGLKIIEIIGPVPDPNDPDSVLITKENAKEHGFPICPKCGAVVMSLANENECAKCEYLRKNPNAVKHVCAACAHFRHHELYEPENHDGFCCKKFLEGKNADSYRYDCPGFAPAKEQEIQLTLNL